VLNYIKLLYQTLLYQATIVISRGVWGVIIIIKYLLTDSETRGQGVQI